MPFELDSQTTAKVLEVAVLSQKNRQPDEDPGVKLTLQVMVSNDVLSTIDGTLKGWLYTRAAGGKPADKQGTLDGVEPISDMPDLSNVGSHVKSFTWSDELTGYLLTIEHGMGGRSNIEVDDCKLSNFKISPKPNGTVLLKFECESPNVSEKTWGKLAKLKSRDIEMLLLAPDVTQASIDDEPASNVAKMPTRDATSAFVEAHAGSAK